MNELPAKDVKIDCLLCGKRLRPLEHSEDDLLAQANWDDAEVTTFVCGYGSGFDMSIFVIGLCDECIAKKLVESQEKGTTFRLQTSEEHIAEIVETPEVRDAFDDFLLTPMEDSDE